MPTESVFLQITSQGPDVKAEESKLRTPPLNGQWEKFKLTVDGERIVGVEITGRYTGTQTYTLEKYKGQMVRLHNIQVLMGGKWREVHPKNDATRKLIDWLRDKNPAESTTLNIT